MGPVGDFLETIDPNFRSRDIPERLCKIARQLMDGETLPDPPERSKGGVPGFPQPGERGGFVDALLSVDLKKKGRFFVEMHMILLEDLYIWEKTTT